MIDASAGGATIVSIVHDAVRDVVREEIRAALSERPLSTTRNAGTDDGLYLSTKRAASVAGVFPGTVRRWIKSRQLPAVRISGIYRIKREHLDAFLAGGPVAWRVYNV
jgi:excisionase family DNA binding protein